MAENKKSPSYPFKKHIPKEARQHAKAAHQEMRESWEALFPPEFVEHRKAARKEMLMAARSMIDAAIDRVDES